MIHGLPALEPARALDPCRRPEGSWDLGTGMSIVMIIFRACANTPEVSFVANNNDDEEEKRTTLLGLPVEARVTKTRFHLV